MADFLPPAGRATTQDVIEAPEGMVAEIIEGVLQLHSRPTSRYAYAVRALESVVLAPLKQGDHPSRDWRIRAEPRLHFGEDILVPDLAGWRGHRLPQGDDAQHLDVVPDWVCEVLSPATRRLDLTAKRKIYGREGVAHLWLVDPDAQVLEPYVLEAGAWWITKAFHGDQRIHLAPFEAIEFPLSALWPD